MKVITDPIANQVRETIELSRKKISENKKIRTDLIQKIRGFKTNIKVGENLCSKLEDAKIDCSYIRDDLKMKRNALNNLRFTLVSEEVNYRLELARFRVLHKILDDMGAQFNPNAKRKGS